MNIIAIAGGSGSGKSYLAAALKEKLKGNVAILSYDRYYKVLTGMSLEERAKVNFDDPKSLDKDLFYAHLNALKTGNSVELPIYNFATHSREKETIHLDPPETLIVEGIMVLEEEDFLPLYDKTIFIDTEEAVRKNRRIVRDTKERGRTLDSVLEQWAESVQPMHERYVSPSRKNAEFLFTNNGSNGIPEEDLAILLRYLNS